MRKILLIVVFMGLISSCSVFGPVNSGPSKTYVISSMPCNVYTCKQPRKGTLLVANIDADPMYNTTDMAYSTSLYQLSYFAKNGWAEPPALMLQPLVIQTLQNTNCFRAVISSSTSSHVDYVLNIKLLELRQVFHSYSSEIHMKLRAQLMRTSDNHIVATREFCFVEPAPEYGPYGGVVAANRATTAFLSELARFVGSRS